MKLPLRALSLAATLSGCAAGSGFLELTDLNFADRTRTRRTPIGDVEREVVVEARAMPSWRLTCTARTRHAQERVTDESWTYTPVRRAIIGLFGAGEGALSAYALVNGFGDTPRSAVDLSVGIAAGVDGLASLLLALFLNEQHALVDFDHEGPWSPTAGCPAGLYVEHEGTRLDFSTEGTLAPEAERVLSRDLVERAGPLRIGLGTQGQDVVPTVPARCAWARAIGHAAVSVLCPPAHVRLSAWSFRMEFHTRAAD